VKAIHVKNTSTSPEGLHLPEARPAAVILPMMILRT